MQAIRVAIACMLLSSASAHGLGLDIGKALGALTDVGKAVTVTDEDVRAMGRDLRHNEETTLEQVAPDSDAYAQRLARLTDPYRSYDGLELNYKVYLSPQINANSTPDGSVRVYSGLMDIVSDDELMFVIAHEIGHIKAGHPAARLRTGLTAGGFAKAAGTIGGGRAPLASEQLSGLLASAVKGQHSQAQEIEADDYGVAFLKKNHIDAAAAGTFLRKLAEIPGDNGKVFSAHPDPVKRAERLGM